VAYLPQDCAALPALRRLTATDFSDWVVAAQFGWLTNLRHLRSLRVDDLDSLGDSALLSSLTYLTLLQDLSLSLRPRRVSMERSQIFDIGAALMQLTSLSVNGACRTWVMELPSNMSRLVVLRHLDIRGVVIHWLSPTLTTLTSLRRLVLLWDSPRPMASGFSTRLASMGGSMDVPPVQLPTGMSALRNLVDLRLSCYNRLLRPQALPALQHLHLDAVRFGCEVRLALLYSPAQQRMMWMWP